MSNGAVINTDTAVESVAVDGQMESQIKAVCKIQGTLGRRLAAAFVLADGGGSRVVLIFQAAPA